MTKRSAVAGQPIGGYDRSLVSHPQISRTPPAEEHFLTAAPHDSRTMPRVNRLFIRILLYALLGVATSVAVAWACALATETETGMYADNPYWYFDARLPDPKETSGTEYSGWSGTRAATMGVERTDLLWTTNPRLGAWSNNRTLPLNEIIPPYARTHVRVWRYDRRNEWPDEAIRGGSQDTHIAASGWPLLCLWGYRHEWTIGSDQVNDGFRMLAVREPGRGGGAMTLIPMAPIWPGLLANTAIYASAWYLLLTLMGLHIRTVRRWQGYCAHCRYDMRNNMSGMCPECGTER